MSKNNLHTLIKNALLIKKNANHHLTTLGCRRSLICKKLSICEGQYSEGQQNEVCLYYDQSTKNGTYDKSLRA